MPATDTFGMQNVSVVLDGLQVTGFFDGDDVVMVEQNTDVGQLAIGADGFGVYSLSADHSVKITLKLQHTSATHKQLQEKWKGYRGGSAKGFPFSIKDLTSNEGGSTDECFIMTAPYDQKGMNATVREWVLVSTEWNIDVING